MRKIGLITVPVLLLLATQSIATPVWAGGAGSFAHTFGGPSDFLATSIQQTVDGGFIVAGFTSSSGAPPQQTWLLRLDRAGVIVWQIAYGTPDTLSSLFPPKAKPTPDGGFVVVTSKHLSPATIAAWVFKVDRRGNFVWQEAFTGTGNATGTSNKAEREWRYRVAEGLRGIRSGSSHLDSNDARWRISLGWL